jgi:hypothetical protein
MWSFPVIAILKAPPRVVPAFPLPQLAFGGTLWPPGDPAERFGFNMKQISTGAGLVALSVGMVATAFIVSQRGDRAAFAQGTGGERRVVLANLLNINPPNSSPILCAYRIWSDNSIDLRPVGIPQAGAFNCRGQNNGNVFGYRFTLQGFTNPTSAGGECAAYEAISGWTTIDNGTSGFRPLTDVDMSGETDAGDISQVLMDFNTSSNDLPPPPIDCNINAPR